MITASRRSEASAGKKVEKRSSRLSKSRYYTQRALDSAALSSGPLKNKAMTKTQIYSLMIRCNGAQLDAITTLLGLNPAFLPDSGAIATRAAKILELVEQQNLFSKL